MFKFLFYLFLFYVIFRYVFGGFRFKVYHYHQQAPRQEPERGEEGRITINPSVQKEKNSSTDKIGEYVDYEEVK